MGKWGEHAFQVWEETLRLHPKGQGRGLGREGLLAAEGWCGLSSGTCPPQAQGIPYLQSPNPEKEQR